jgi:hypothetical protein
MSKAPWNDLVRVLEPLNDVRVLEPQNDVQAP